LTPRADVAVSPLAPVAVGAAALATVGLAGAVAPHGQAFYPPCPLHALTGIYCPGCGATRAVHALAGGHLVTALHDNVLLVAVVPLAIAVWVSWLLRTMGYDAPKLLPLTPRRAWLLGLVMAVFAVVRNLPFGPFHALAPIA
jgi:hypothetical protein